MSKENNFLEVKNLTVEYVTKEETVHAVNDVSFSLEKGKVLGMVGETGAGKTTIARTILRILQEPPAELRSGEIYLDGKNLLEMSEEEMYDVRGKRITMIFQDPMTSLNPVMTVGSQIAEIIELHNDIPKKDIRHRAEEMLETVGIPAERYDEYPHQFSGGMKQRVVIAIALACNPELLLADEPTTALDVTIQAQVLELMQKLNQENNTTTILITHDLGVVAEMCDEVVIVYAGEIVESGSLEDIFENPTHPYTIGLFGALPDLNSDVEWLSPIDGLPPDPTDLPKGCKFNPRCPQVCNQCRTQEVGMTEITPGHFCRCILVEKKEA
ncbi:MAG: ABC transporter ATP-binding protein [Clostridiales bacterium]|nr:ABC transporter ATP-binding protein [Clostridiales bacterium]